MVYTYSEYYLALKRKEIVGHLGGSAGQVSNFGSGHDLTVHGFEPRIKLCADSLEPALDSVSPSLSALPPLVVCLSLSFSLSQK